jgi:hypothetical protein
MERERRLAFYMVNRDEINNISTAYMLEVERNGKVVLRQGQTQDNLNEREFNLKIWRDEQAYLRDKNQVKQIFGFVPSLHDHDANLVKKHNSFDAQLQARFPDLTLNSVTKKYEFMTPNGLQKLSLEVNENVYRSTYTLRDNRLVIADSKEEAIAFAYLNKERLGRDRFVVVQDLRSKQGPNLSEDLQAIKSGYPKGGSYPRDVNISMRENPSLTSLLWENSLYDRALAQLPRENKAEQWSVVIALKDDKQAQIAKDLANEHGLASLRLSPNKSWAQALEQKTQRREGPALGQ